MINTAFGSFILSLFPLIIILAQFSYKLNYEAGYFKNTESNYERQNDFQTSCDGLIKYEDDEDDKNISCEIRIRPELYGIKNKLNILKLRAKGNYYKYEENYNWGLNLSVQKYFYKNSTIDINYENLMLNGDMRFSLSDDLYLYLSPGFAYQRINSNGFRDLDLIFLEAKLENSLSKYFALGYGFYSEKFFIEDKPALPDLKLKNNGWRIGPLLNLKYSHDLILSTGYQFLFHFSEVTHNISFEQSIRIIFGKILDPHWSIFILVDLYFRRYLLNESIDKIQGVIYSQMNSENRFYLKTAYELWDGFELYSKSGYARENLDYITYKIAGWNVVFGVDLDF
jgi:hypothetical protein